MSSVPWSSGPDRFCACACLRACVRVCAHCGLVPGLARPPRPSQRGTPRLSSPVPRPTLGSTRSLGGLLTASVVLTVQCFFLAGEEDGRDQSKLETKVWEARNPLVDKQIDQFLVVAR